MHRHQKETVREELQLVIIIHITVVREREMGCAVFGKYLHCSFHTNNSPKPIKSHLIQFRVIPTKADKQTDTRRLLLLLVRATENRFWNDF